MEFAILGPLEVRDDGRALVLGAAKQRALLAVLLLHANQVVSRDRLIDDLWGERPPPTAAKALQVYVSQLRKVLPRNVLVTRQPGYLIELEPDRLDLARFERLVREGEQARGCGDASAAARKLHQALGIWRGTPLADFASEPFAQLEIARLEEARLAALEERIGADLELGRHAALIGEIEGLVARHPLRERLRGLLMLALYRAGRQAEALDAYRETRALLVDELGLEPGPELRRLERSILAHDPALDVSPTEPAPTPVDAFVGRERQMAGLEAALDDALSAHGRLVLVSGEPGIGKSRLAEELSGRAADRGAEVLWGRCWEAGGAPAYWPWVQSLRAHLRGCSPDVVRAQTGPGAVELARILPELREVMPELPLPAASEPEGTRFRLFEAVTALLRSAASQRPLMIVLDDVHAADAPSLLLLRFAATELVSVPILILVAYRDVAPVPGDPLIAAVTELERVGITRRMSLGGLGKDDVARFIERSTGVASRPGLAATIHDQTGGNPLFVGEIVRLMASEGGLVAPHGPLASPARIPRGVHDAIDRRLAFVPEPARDLLASASVIGREFDLEVLRRLAGAGGGELDLLDDAVSARLVEEVRESAGRMRFAHALIRDTLYEYLPPIRRARLHRRVGEALESIYSADDEPHLAELAHHFAAAAAEGEAGKAVEYARHAGDRAVALLAFEEAVRLYGLALEKLRGEGTATDRLRCELLIALADAQGRAGDSPGAKAALLRAAQLARSVGLPELLARAAANYGGRFLWARAFSDEELVPLLEDALSTLGEADSVLRVQLLSRLGAALRREPSRERRERVCEEAVQAARRIGDPGTIAYALAAAEAALHGPRTVVRRMAEADEIVSLAEKIGDRERLFDGHEHAFWAAWELGDPDRRAAALRSMMSVAEKLRQPAQLWMLAAAQATVAIAEGRFAQAAELIDRAATVGARAQSWEAAATRRLQLFGLRREQGDLESVEREVRDFAHEFPSPLVQRSVLAYVCVRVGRRAEAAAILEELTGHDLSAWHVDEEWLASISLLAEVCVLLEDSERAGALYALLAPYAPLNAVAVPEVALDSTHRPLGILATMLGRFADASDHFEQALTMNARMGARPAVAHTEKAYALMAAARGGPGDRERALALAARAREGYRKLEMPTYADEAAQLERALRAASDG